MGKDSQMITNCGSSEETSQQRTAPKATQIYHPVRSIGKILVEDWHTSRYTLFGILLVLLTTLVVLAYYLNRPFAEPRTDTISYLYVVNLIQNHGQLVNTWRLPGYPLLIVLVYALAGQGNLSAVGFVHLGLFVLTTLELYILVALVLKRAWVAFLIGLLVGANLPMLSFVKPILSEALALWLVVSLTLAAVWYLYTLRAGMLWLVTLCLLLLLLTRPEWIFLPVPLFIYLLLMAASRGRLQNLLPHALASVALLFAVMAGYVYINATQNGVPQVTVVENINALGKVVQYHMQDEAPPQYASISRRIDSYVARGITDPYTILRHEPALADNNSTRAGEFAGAIIERHIGEFLLKTIPVAFFSLSDFHAASNILPNGALGTPLLRLESVFLFLYRWNALYPLCAAIWLFLLCWKRTRHLRIVQTMGAVVLIGLYGLIVTALGAYSSYDYTRIHTIFNPLLITVIWGSLLMGALLLARRGSEALVWLARR